MCSFRNKSRTILFTIISLLFVIAFFAQKQSIAADEPACQEAAVEVAGGSNTVCQTVPNGDFLVYLPFLKRPPLAPVTISIIRDSFRGDAYTVTWTPVEGAVFTLEEASDASFSDARVVYDGVRPDWSVLIPDGKRPGTYYYRVRYVIDTQMSPWSKAESIVIQPLYVGLSLHWDGIGYIDFEGQHYEPGMHLRRNIYEHGEPNTLRSNNYLWYYPDPLSFGASRWDELYTADNGEFIPPPGYENSPWKWSYPWILPYDVNLHNGQTFNIEGQAFLVSGPHSGTTAFGHPVQYWQLVNRDRFVLYDDGGEYQLLVHANEVVLHFDAGMTRLLLHDDMTRHLYHNWADTGNTVRYVSDLTAADSFGYPPKTPTAREPVEGERGAPSALLPIPGLGRMPYTGMPDLQ